MTWAQPAAFAAAIFSAEPTVPMTLTPRAFAHWLRIWPTPPAAAQAQGRMYKCVDASGKTFYTQTPPKECLGRTVDELAKRYVQLGLCAEVKS